jgi:hypothetical protein
MARSTVAPGDSPNRIDPAPHVTIHDRRLHVVTPSCHVWPNVCTRVASTKRRVIQRSRSEPRFITESMASESPLTRGRGRDAAGGRTPEENLTSWWQFPRASSSRLAREGRLSLSFGVMASTKPRDRTGLLKVSHMWTRLAWLRLTPATNRSVHCSEGAAPVRASASPRKAVC